MDSLQELQTALASAKQLKENAKITELARSILTVVEGLEPLEELPTHSRAQALLHKGIALSAQETYDKAAEEALTRSIKLEPSNGDSWNCLGEIFYLKKDFAQARRCFEGSLESAGDNKTALQKLSMISRLIEDSTEKAQAVKDSVELARKALALDMRDGYSWYVLANAHLTNYFVNNLPSLEIQKALKAYRQAEKLLPVPEVDLHCNRGVAFKYMELYQEACEDFSKAHELDKDMGADQELAGIVERVGTIVGHIRSKGGLKKKEITRMVKRIPMVLKNSPFGEGYLILTVKQLVYGVNSRTILSLKVVSSLNKEESEVPAVFLVCDGSGEFFSLSVYNNSRGMHQNIIDSAGAFIKDPVLVPMRLNIQGLLSEYNSVKVIDPNNIMLSDKDIRESVVPSMLINQSAK